MEYRIYFVLLIAIIIISITFFTLSRGEEQQLDAIPELEIRWLSIPKAQDDQSSLQQQ
jgi:hypothetical protein